MRPLSHAQMSRAFATDDARYDGRFYVGVRTTGIYCLPSCKAKLPNLKNVRFFPTREEAIAAGFRGCKRCKSERFPDVLPDWLRPMLATMRERLTDRFDEGSLAGMTGVDISTVRRYFRTHLNTTPLAFHRRLRLEFARELIENGMNYLQAAFEAGYESSSGFRAAFSKHFGKPPGEFYGKRNNRLS